jgi:hypothetical protein
VPKTNSLSVGLLFLVLSITCSENLIAQDRCGAVNYTSLLKAHRQLPETEKQFEQWLQKKSQQKRTANNARKQAGPYKIPIVVHVIHNGEAVGSGTNIPDAQIISQVKVLNDDFRRQNSDKTNTPASFVSVAGSMDIEFVLATTDPDGLATNGIVRKKGTQNSWTMSDNYDFKSLSHWPSTDYLNIWVLNLTDYLGYAQYPISDLPGLENSPDNAVTDGVAITSDAFGTIDAGNFNIRSRYDKGRTTTHEVAHFFGLRHIWGDESNCNGNDFIDDTPTQAGSSGACVAHPRSDQCSTSIMFQNFMDYTDDVCMNLFTKLQMDRMSIVIENCIRRKSLLTSPGSQPPAPVANNLGISDILTPQVTECLPDVIPSIKIFNYGNNVATHTRIHYSIDDNIIETKDLTINLAPLQSTTVNFDPITLAIGNTSLFKFEILQTNHVTDAVKKNDTVSTTVFIPQSITTPFLENFNTLPLSWTTQNHDSYMTWIQATAPNGDPNNQALLLNFYDSPQGEQDIYISPVFDLNNADIAYLLFDLAYAKFDSESSDYDDRLKVYVLPNCSSIQDGVLVYEKGAEALQTSSPTSSAFVPSYASEWRKEFINLTQFAGQTKMQLAFVGISALGNQLFIDNIAVVTSDKEDIALNKIVSPSLVTCDDSPDVVLSVQNMSIKTINTVTVNYTTNSTASQSKTLTDLMIAPGEVRELTLPAVQLTKSINTLSVTLSNPNGVEDKNSENDNKLVKIIINQSQNRIPFRENFDGKFDEQWTIASPDGGSIWEAESTNYRKSIYYNAFKHADIGNQTWLVSPVLDFSRWPEASMQFDISYRSRAGKQEQLKVLTSRDCGNTYQEEYFRIPTKDEDDGNWKPNNDEEWDNNLTLDLSPYAINREKNMRIAFVVTNKNGNNLYIDNIEFFTTARPDNLEVEEPYSVFGYNFTDLSSNNLKIKFNLPERQHVKCYFVNSMGSILDGKIWYDVLNQTYDLSLENKPAPGIYLIQLSVGNKFYTTKIVVSQ